MTEPVSIEGNYRVLFLPGWFFPTWFGGGPAIVVLAYVMARVLQLPTPWFTVPAVVFAVFGIAKLAIVDKNAKLCIDARGLSIDDRLRIAAPLHSRRIDQRWARSIQIDGAGGEATIHGISRSVFDQWLERSNSTTTWRLMSRRFGLQARSLVWALVGGTVMAIALKFEAGEPLLRCVPAAVTGVVALGVALYMRREQIDVEVTPTGVTIKQLDERRFVPIEEILSCSLTIKRGVAEGFVIQRYDGTTEAVRFPSVSENRFLTREEPARGAADAITRTLAAREAAPPRDSNAAH